MNKYTNFITITMYKDFMKLKCLYTCSRCHSKYFIHNRNNDINLLSSYIMVHCCNCNNTLTVNRESIDGQQKGILIEI